MAIAMLRTSPLTDAVSVIVGVLSGVPAWRNWLRIVLEDRRHAADTAEAAQRKAEIEAEFARWTDRLKDRPSDAEMEAWLDRDRTVLLARAMDHYKLARSQVITYAFLEEPGNRAKHARLPNGPMRYSRYTLIVFVLTSDGVRQMSADLGFVAVTLRLGDRISYRSREVARPSLVSSRSSHSRRTRLLRGGVSPAMLRSVVVLPAPLRPSRATSTARKGVSPRADTARHTAGEAMPASPSGRNSTMSSRTAPSTSCQVGQVLDQRLLAELGPLITRMLREGWQRDDRALEIRLAVYLHQLGAQRWAT